MRTNRHKMSVFMKMLLKWSQAMLIYVVNVINNGNIDYPYFYTHFTHSLRLLLRELYRHTSRVFSLVLDIDK